MAAGFRKPSRSNNRRIDSLTRERDSIRRILTQAGLDGVRDDVEILKAALDSIEERLSGDEP